MAITIQVRRDTQANWIASDAVLAPGEFGYETDTGGLKIGNGEARWADLDYYNSVDVEVFEAIEAQLQNLQEQNITEEALHTAVANQIEQLQSAVIDDDGPSLFLLYENAKA